MFGLFVCLSQKRMEKVEMFQFTSITGTMLNHAESVTWLGAANGGRRRCYREGEVGAEKIQG